MYILLEEELLCKVCQFNYSAPLIVDSVCNIYFEFMGVEMNTGTYSVTISCYIEPPTPRPLGQPINHALIEKNSMHSVSIHLHLKPLCTASIFHLSPGSRYRL